MMSYVEYVFLLSANVSYTNCPRSRISFRNTVNMTNTFDKDQALHAGGPDQKYQQTLASK